LGSFTPKDGVGLLRPNVRSAASTHYHDRKRRRRELLFVGKIGAAIQLQQGEPATAAEEQSNVSL
jgi:hypothetical protein